MPVRKADQGGRPSILLSLLTVWLGTNRSEAGAARWNDFQLVFSPISHWGLYTWISQPITIEWFLLHQCCPESEMVSSIPFWTTLHNRDPRFCDRHHVCGEVLRLAPWALSHHSEICSTCLSSDLGQRAWGMYRLSVDEDDKITVVLDDLPEQLRASQRKKTEFVLLVRTSCLPPWLMENLRFTLWFLTSQFIFRVGWSCSFSVILFVALCSCGWLY